MLKKSLNYLCAALLLGLVTQSAWANLLINPTRVEFNPSDRLLM
jgi:P pilus assembly chaperone PapD